VVPGILDVAREAGVSVATVSRALRGLPGVSANTRKAVEVAAADLGYVASPTAAALPTGRTRTVGVLAPWVTRWFFTAVIEGANQVFCSNGYDVLLYALDPVVGPQGWNVFAVAKRVDGVLGLCLPPVSTQYSHLAGARSQLVVVGSGPAGTPGVNIDDVAVGRAATEHLIALGHRRIGFAAGGPPDLLQLPVAADRRRGCAEALRDAGLELDPGDVFDADFSVAGGEHAAAALMCRTQRPTAIVAGCDEIAMGLIHGVRSRGLRVPGDLSVVGVDDHDMARLFGLTTIAQPAREQGRLAAQMLLDRIAGEQTTPLLVQTRLVVRQTSAGAATS